MGSRKEHSRGACPAPHRPCPPPRALWGWVWGVWGGAWHCSAVLSQADAAPGPRPPPIPVLVTPHCVPSLSQMVAGRLWVGAHFPQGHGAGGWGSWDQNHVCQTLIPGPLEAPGEAASGGPVLAVCLVRETDAAQMICTNSHAQQSCLLQQKTSPRRPCQWALSSALETEKQARSN